MFKLFWAPRSCSLASLIAFEEVGAQYETQRINLVAGEQRSPAYLAINPKGRIPTLVTDRGILVETPAILAFIAQSFPDAGLMPLGDPFAFAQIQAFNSYLCSTLHVAHAYRLRPNRWADDPVAMKEMRRKVPDSVGSCFEHIENELLNGPWVMGEAYTICDPYLFTVAQWIEADGIDPTRFPNVVDHRRRMFERKSVQKIVVAGFL